MRKYDRGLHHTMRHELHSLDMTERVHFRIATTAYHCLNRKRLEIETPFQRTTNRKCHVTREGAVKQYGRLS